MTEAILLRSLVSFKGLETPRVQSKVAEEVGIESLA